MRRWEGGLGNGRGPPAREQLLGERPSLEGDGRDRLAPRAALAEPAEPAELAGRQARLAGPAAAAGHGAVGAAPQREQLAQPAGLGDAPVDLADAVGVEDGRIGQVKEGLYLGGVRGWGVLTATRRGRVE